MEHHSEHDLQTKADRLSHLLQVMPAGVIVINNNGIINQVNTLAKELLGEPLEGCLWRDVISRSFNPQADDGHEVSLKDGKRVKLSITPLLGEKGQLIVITDLTETRELQSRISHLQKLSSLGKMVATLAHQVRTPLSSAMLYAANLNSLNLNNPTANRFTEKLITRLKDLESQVNDMLLFAKSGDKQIVKPVSISNVLRSSIRAVEAQAYHNNIQIITKGLSREVTVMGNETALAGAISNLLHNAIQASATHGCVTVMLEQNQIAQKDMAIVKVMDQGEGIDEAQVQKIFEPFYTSKSQGTGLGLAVVKSVAQTHKGEIKASNNPNSAGACFALSLPALIEPSQQINEHKDNFARVINIA